MKKMVLVVCSLVIVSVSAYAGGRRAPAADGPLRVGMMLAAESLPLMVARDLGYFEREGVNVELVLFSNPIERDAALQAGQLDASITDLLAAAFFVAAGFDFRVTSSTDGRFGFAASPQSEITELSQLRGASLGISLNSVIQYVLDTKLQYEGISPEEYEAVSVPSVPMRVEMVLAGTVDAVGLPEPVLTAAVAGGAALLSTTDDLGIDATVLMFSQRVLDTRLAEIRAFYRAYYAAATRINASPDDFRDFLVENVGFPPAVRDTFRFVTYRRPALPEAGQIESALSWLSARGLLDANISAHDMVDGRAVTGW